MVSWKSKKDVLSRMVDMQIMHDNLENYRESNWSIRLSYIFLGCWVLLTTLKISADGIANLDFLMSFLLIGLIVLSIWDSYVKNALVDLLRGYKNLIHTKDLAVLDSEVVDEQDDEDDEDDFEDFEYFSFIDINNDSTENPTEDTIKTLYNSRFQEILNSGECIVVNWHYPSRRAYVEEFYTYTMFMVSKDTEGYLEYVRIENDDRF